MGLCTTIKEWRPSEISSEMLSTWSVIYCLFLLAVYVVPTSTGMITYPEPYTESGTNSDTVGIWILIFLFGGSNLYLIYLFLVQSRPSRSIQGDSANGSAFVRVGAVIFGLGSLIYLILCLIDAFKAESNCTLQLQLTMCLGLIFVLLQLAALLLSPRIQIDNHWGGAHFGLMHLLATNLILWMWAVEIESLHILHYAEEDESKTRFILLEKRGSREKRAAEPGMCGLWVATSKLSKSLEPIFYPFLIEFALIGATVFLNTWRKVQPTLCDRSGSCSLVRPQPIAYLAGQDWTNSSVGWLVGFPVLLCNAAIWLYFSNRPEKSVHCDHKWAELGTSTDVVPGSWKEEQKFLEAFKKCGGSDPITGEEIAKICFCLLDMSGIIALIYGFIQISKLPERQHHHDHTIDKCLLRFALFFGFIFLVFTGAIGVFPKDPKFSGGASNALHILNSAIGILFGALQVLFIEALMDKTVSKRQKILHGRQAVTFLILLNLSIWAGYTFGLQKPIATVLEEHYYSLKPWIIIQRITLPVIIFFRFHSLVLLVELWKNSYRAEDTDEKRYTITVSAGGKKMRGWLCW